MKPPVTRLMAAFRAHILLLIFLCDVGTLRSFLGSPGNEHSSLSIVSLVCMPFPRKAALALRSTTSGLLPPSAARFEFPGDNQARALPARPPAHTRKKQVSFYRCAPDYAEGLTELQREHLSAVEGSTCELAWRGILHDHRSL